MTCNVVNIAHPSDEKIQEIHCNVITSTGFLHTETIQLILHKGMYWIGYFFFWENVLDWLLEFRLSAFACLKNERENSDALYICFIRLPFKQKLCYGEGRFLLYTFLTLASFYEVQISALH